MKLPALYEAVRRNLAALKDIVEIKEVRDKAIGLEGWGGERRRADGRGGQGAQVADAPSRRGDGGGPRRGTDGEAGAKKKIGGLSPPISPPSPDQGVDKDLAKLARAAAAWAKMSSAKLWSTLSPSPVASSAIFIFAKTRARLFKLRRAQRVHNTSACPKNTAGSRRAKSRKKTLADYGGGTERFGLGAAGALRLKWRG
jgi:hypothetical protein